MIYLKILKNNKEINLIIYKKIKIVKKEKNF